METELNPKAADAFARAAAHWLKCGPDLLTACKRARTLIFTARQTSVCLTEPWVSLIDALTAAIAKAESAP